MGDLGGVRPISETGCVTSRGRGAGGSSTDHQEGYSSRRAKMRTSPRVVAAGVMSWRRQGTLHRGHAWPTESKWPWTHPWQNVWPHGSVQASSKSSWQSGHDSVFWRPAMSWGVGGGVPRHHAARAARRMPLALPHVHVDLAASAPG